MYLYSFNFIISRPWILNLQVWFRMWNTCLILICLRYIYVQTSITEFFTYLFRMQVCVIQVSTILYEKYWICCNSTGFFSFRKLFFFKVKEICNTHAWEFQNELYFGHIKNALNIRNWSKVYIYTNNE